ncbi:MAG: hypothetical protein M1282_12590 [Chloroflexi bacterium]|nr:hypothetical protein [Chloroflexota bacterium]
MDRKITFAKMKFIFNKTRLMISPVRRFVTAKSGEENEKSPRVLSKLLDYRYVDVLGASYFYTAEPISGRPFCNNPLHRFRL